MVPEAVDALNDDTIHKMKVLDLRKELGMHGLSKNGNKGVLVKRLKEGIKKYISLLVDTPTEQIENSTGDGFEAGTYWRLLEATGPPFDDSIMEVDGVLFRAPTTTEEEHKKGNF